MIGNIQLLRGLAALGVVFSHTTYLLPPYGVHTHFNGVAVFFVISGFIMAYIRKDGALPFARDRFTRIVPFYWLVTLAMVLVSGAGLLNLPYTLPVIIQQAQVDLLQPFRTLANNLRADMTDARIEQIIQTLLFLPKPPGGRDPVLLVGWTLNLEVFYYLVFALCLTVSHRLAAVIVAVVLVGLWCAGDLSDDYRWKALTTINNLYFACGILIHYVAVWLRNVPLERFRAIIIVSVAILAAFYLSYHWAYPFYSGIPTSLLTSPLLPASVVLAAVVAHMAGVRCDWKPALVLGEASYALYLVHLFVVEVMRPIGQVWPSLDASKNLGAAAFVVGLSVALAFAAHYAVEKPVLRALRRQPRPVAVASVGA